MASLTVDVMNGAPNNAPAAGWTAGYATQEPGDCGAACRDVTAVAGGGVMPLKLSCANAQLDGEWQFAHAGTALNCTIVTSRQAVVAVGQYTLSLDAAMRTE